MPPIIVVASAKGGQTKTTTAVHLAPALGDGAVLVDLDFQRRGGATGMLGAEPRPWLLDALEAGRPPRIRRGSRRAQPDLVPTSGDELAASRVEPDLITESLQSWSSEWDRPLIVDTHAGITNPITAGAIDAAHLTLLMVQLEEASLRGLAEAIEDLGAGHPLLVVPTRIPARPSELMVRRLRQIVGSTPVAPVISNHAWMNRRRRTSALTLVANGGAPLRRAAEEYRNLATEVVRWTLTVSCR